MKFLCALMIISSVRSLRQTAEDWNKAANKELTKALNLKQNNNVAKNVILFLGDGMDITTVTATRILRGQVDGTEGMESLLHFESFPHVGLSKTYSVDRQTADSAATATAFLCGIKTKMKTLGVDSGVEEGNCSSQAGREVLSILQWAHEAGKSTGIVTTTRITHATPAAAYAHVASRNWEGDSEMKNVNGSCKDIAWQLIEDNPHIRVLLGGGRRYFLGKGQLDPNTGKPNSKYGRVDERDLTEVWKKDKEKQNRKPYRYVWNKGQFDRVDAKNTNYLLGLFSQSHMSFELDRNTTDEGQPSLAAMTQKAIEILRKNDKGFFLLVEGGRIDHGHHLNMAKRALYDALAFDDAVKEASALLSTEDTLMVVTADHAHALNIAGYSTRETPLFDVVDERQWSRTVDKMPYTVLVYSNGPGFDIDRNGSRRNLTDVNTTSRDYRQESAVNMSSATHSGTDVAVYARGPMAHLFHGVHEQNYIAHVMAYAACIGKRKEHCRRPEENNPSPPICAGTLVSISSFTFPLAFLCVFLLSRARFL